MEHAVGLAPQMPSIRMRAVNFYSLIDDAKHVLAHSVEVLAATSVYDGPVFDTLRATGVDSVAALEAMRSNPRAVSAWFLYLCRTAADESTPDREWQWLTERKLADEEGAVAYSNVLLSRNKGAEAVRMWAAWKKPVDARYGSGETAVFNSSWELPLTASGLDWQVVKHRAVKADVDTGTGHTGTNSLLVHFSGTENLVWEHVRQRMFLAKRTHFFSAWVKTDNLTTDQGVHFRILDPSENAGFDYRTESITGTTDGWVRLQGTVAIPHDGTYELRVARLPSRKIDSKINGRIWIDDVNLTRNAEPRDAAAPRPRPQ